MIYCAISRLHELCGVQNDIAALEEPSEVAYIVYIKLEIDIFALKGTRHINIPSACSAMTGSACV